MQKNRTGNQRRYPEGSDPLVRMYLNDVSKLGLLTVEEERELGRRIRSGDVMAFHKLIESNLRFVIKIAKTFVRNREQFMDLVNAGNVGLIEAARRFDPEANVRFITYAVWWIRQAIFQHLAGMAFPFRISTKVANIVYKIRRTLNQTSLRLDRVSDREQLANRAGISIAELNSALQALCGTVSLDHPIFKDGDLTMSNMLAETNPVSPSKQAMIESLRRSLERSIESLSPVEQVVIRLRFGLNHSPMTLKEIGTKLNRSRERIRQIENDSLKKLKFLYCNQAFNSYWNETFH